MRFTYAKYLPDPVGLSALLFFLLFSTACIAAEGTADTAEETQAVFWNFVIAVIVLATLIASAALPVAALRQWPGRWRYLAMFPLATLMLLLVVIVIKFEHALWSLNNPVLVVARNGIKLIRTFVHIQPSKILFEKLVALYTK